jgi:UDP-glucose 4-epimerase
MSPRVLITGAAGYIGRATTAALVARRDAPIGGRVGGGVNIGGGGRVVPRPGEEPVPDNGADRGADRGAEIGAIVALDLREPPPAERLDGVTYVAADITDGARVREVIEEHRIDAVVHLAAILRPPPGAPPDLAYRVDVEGTRHVLDACVACGVRQLITTSSGAAYGYYADNPVWLDEEDAIRGNAEIEYARNKRLVEDLLSDYRERHPQLAQIVFRPGTVIGSGVSTPVTALFEQPVMLGVWGSAAPFVFIWDQDVVGCILEGIFAGKRGIYNLAGDGALTPKEIARRLGKPYVPIPAPVLRAALGLLHSLGLSPYGPEYVDFLRYRPVLSNRRLKEEFGYRPALTSAAAFERYAQGRSA